MEQRTVEEMEIQIRNEILPVIDRNFSVNSYVNIIFGSSRSWESKYLQTPYFVKLIKNVGEEPKMLRINMENDALNCQIIQKRVEKCVLMIASIVVHPIPGHGIFHGLHGHGPGMGPLWGPPGPANPAAGPLMGPIALVGAGPPPGLGGPGPLGPGGPANPVIPPGGGGGALGP